jgi:hypothetical protein
MTAQAVEPVLFLRRTPDPEPHVARSAFPLQALPPAAAEYAHRLSLNGLPGEYVGPAMLASLATAVGGRVTIEAAEGAWSERAALWVALNGESGTIKSPAIRYVRRALDEMERPWAENHARDLADWRQLPRTDRDKTPMPVRRRLTVGDATIEALARRLQESPGGLLMHADELTGLIRGLGQYKKGAGSDRAHLLSMHSGTPLSFDRVSDGGVPIYVAEPTLSILGGIQPAWLKLLDGEDGLSGRWLYSSYPDKELEDDDLVPVRREETGWASLLQSIVQHRDRPRTATLGDSEREQFNAFRKLMKKAKQVETGIPRLWAAKAGSHYLRLALVLAEAERPGQARVDSEALEMAGILTEYFLQQVRALPVRVENLMVAPYQRGQDDAVDRLAAFASQRPTHYVSRRDAQRAHIAGARTPEEVDKLLNRYDLTYPGHVIHGVPPNGGPPSTTIFAPGWNPVESS